MTYKQNTLIIDTAMGACGAALYNGKIFSLQKPMNHGQAEALIPLINSVIAEAKTSYNQLEQIITTIGPGGFTGLRVGLSAAKSLSLALNIPLYGLTSFQAIAASFNSQDVFNVVIESRRGDFFTQRFTPEHSPASDPASLSAEIIWENLEDKSTLFIGDAAQRFKEEIPEALIDGSILYPDLGKALIWAQNNAEALTKDPEPLYLRGADISQSKKQQRQIAS